MDISTGRLSASPLQPVPTRMSLKYVLRLTAPQCPHRQGSRRAPAPCSSATRDVASGSVGRWRCQAVAKGPEAALERQAKAPRSSRLDRAGEAQLLQLAQSTPPAGQARWTLRALARELVAREIVSRIRYETVRCVLKTN